MAIEKSITLKSPEEIELLYSANQIVRSVLETLKTLIREGVTTYQLDVAAEECCRDLGGLPAFKGYRGFPASLCTSVNEEVVHGIPSKQKILRNGDIISLDFGSIFKGYYGDAAITVAVGHVSPLVERLLSVTEMSLAEGIKQAVIGNRVSDISRAIQIACEDAGFFVVKQFVGHGIGTQLHEPPEVPNYVQKQSSPRLLEGMVLAIEPMVNLGTSKVKILKDQWTVVTADRQPSAHFEHSIAITKSGPVILSRHDSPAM
ncbi:MAG: type I methionyl aminopeptidase [Syntrophorhabdus sp.]